MTTEIRDLLDDAADAPRRGIDVDALRHRARRRHRRTGAVVGSVVALALLAAGIAFAATDDRTDVRTPVAAPTDTTDELPDGWHRIDVPEHGVSIAVPADWSRLADDVEPVVDAPPSILVVGSAARTQAGVITACAPSAGIPPVPGTWISIYEYPPGGPFVVPTGEGTTSDVAFVERPSDFRSIQGGGPRCGGVAAGGSSPDGADFLAFRENGRLLYARIVVIGDAEPSGLGFGGEILNTLRVEARDEQPTATTGVVPTTSPIATSPNPVPATTLTPTVGSEEDRVRSVVQTWLGGAAGGMRRAYVEDASSIEEYIAAAAYRGSMGIDALVAEVGDVRLVSDDRAIVRYRGVAGTFKTEWLDAVVLQVDGEWKVSRDSVCELLEVAEVVCPPRGAP